MKMGNSQLHINGQLEKEEEKEEPEVDYRPSEYIDYFGQKEGSKKCQFRVNDLVKMCHDGFKEQLQSGHARISPVIFQLSRNAKIFPK